MNLSLRAKVYAHVSFESESDAVLMGHVVNGEPQAARVLVERYTGPLRKFAMQAGVRPQDADDLLQETWLRVVRSAGRYDPAQPFPRWLFTIAMNRIRSRWQRDRNESLDDTDIATSTAGADESLELQQRAQAIRQLVATLPPHLGDTILLRYFEELSEREVAQRLGVPLGTVKSRLHHGIRRLRSELERIIHV